MNSGSEVSDSTGLFSNRTKRKDKTKEKSFIYGTSERDGCKFS
jgi:hypothetical protein